MRAIFPSAATVLVAGGLALAAGAGEALAKSSASKSAAAPAPVAWLHIEVDDSGPDAERIRVNVPVSLVEAVLPAIRDDDFRGGRIVIHGEHDDHVDLRELWQAVRDQPDGKFVTVRSRRENTSVAKQDGYLVARSRKDGERVDVRMPLPVVEALLSAGDDELDLIAGVRALSRHGEGELVVVDERDSRIRIWVDRRATEGGR